MTLVWFAYYSRSLFPPSVGWIHVEPGSERKRKKKHTKTRSYSNYTWHCRKWNNRWCGSGMSVSFVVGPFISLRAGIRSRSGFHLYSTTNYRLLLRLETANGEIVSPRLCLRNQYGIEEGNEGFDKLQCKQYLQSSTVLGSMPRSS